MKLLCGIDIGTSACKVAVYTQEGEVVALKGAHYPLYYPRAGWAEQNPEDWWNSVCSCLRSVISDSAHYGQIEAVGVTGHSWACVPISSMGMTLHNSPLWMDTRAGDICSKLLERPVGKELEENSGNPLSPTYTTGKILWFKENMPEIYKQTDKFLQSNGFIIYKLTGGICQDISQGYALHIFDIKKRVFSEKLSEQAGIDLKKLPPLMACHEIAGFVNLQAATETGLLPGIPVVAGGLDAACGTLGAGVTKSGMTQEQGGQSGGMSVCLDSPVKSTDLILACHTVPDKWLLQGGTAAGGGALRWAAGLFSLKNYEQADTEAASVPPAKIDSAGPLIFLPYLLGERSPIWDSDAKGMFLGLTTTHSRAHILRAVMEGVAFSLRHNIETAKSYNVSCNMLYSVGGASRSAFWTQLKADITGIPITVPDVTEASALGAAMLAGIGAEVFGSFDKAVLSTVKMGKTFQPNKDFSDYYTSLYNIYIECYERNKDLMYNLGGLGRTLKIKKA